MPIYEYLCEGCGRISEVMQKLTDPRPGTCPECGSRDIARLVSRSAFQLKGGGWYADLYGSSKKEAKASGSAAGAAGGAEKKGEGKEAKTTTAQPSPASEGKPAAPVKKDGG